MQQPPAKPYPVEYYHQVKWGHFDEFMELYRRNHYPILLREQKLGRILSMNATYPVYHAGEAKRWDMRFTIVWKDAATANDDFDQAPIVKELYPDQAKFGQEEQRRFELLVAMCSDLHSYLSAARGSTRVARRAYRARKETGRCDENQRRRQGHRIPGDTSKRRLRIERTTAADAIVPTTSPARQGASASGRSC